jgi:hypothetical protein
MVHEFLLDLREQRLPSRAGEREMQIWDSVLEPLQVSVKYDQDQKERRYKPAPLAD